MHECVSTSVVGLLIIAFTFGLLTISDGTVLQLEGCVIVNRPVQICIPMFGTVSPMTRNYNTFALACRINFWDFVLGKNLGGSLVGCANISFPSVTPSTVHTYKRNFVLFRTNFSQPCRPCAPVRCCGEGTTDSGFPAAWHS